MYWNIGKIILKNSKWGNKFIDNLSIDLISVSIKEAYDALKEIVGLSVNTDLSEEIFSRFCVGK